MSNSKPTQRNENMSAKITKTSSQGKTIETVNTNDLKARFKTRSIPLESDFANLIEVAEYGRRAVGKHPDQKVQLKYTGLELNGTGQLLVKCDEAEGITTTVNGISIKTGNGVLTDKGKVTLHLNSTSGLNLDSFGLSVKTNSNKGISVDASGLSIKENKASGIKVDSNGVGVLVNNTLGVKVDVNGVGVKADNSKGIVVDSNGIGINTSVSNGLEIIADKLSIAINENSGLMLSDNGIQLAPDLYSRMLLELYSPADLYVADIPHGGRCIVMLCYGSQPEGHLIIRYFGTSTVFCGVQDDYFDLPQLVDKSGTAHKPYKTLLKEYEGFGLKIIDAAIFDYDIEINSIILYAFKINSGTGDKWNKFKVIIRK